MRTLRNVALALALVGLSAVACGGRSFPWLRGAPKPEEGADTTGYRVYVWNQGLGELTARDSRHGAVAHVLPGRTGVLHLLTEGRYRIIYTIQGRTYVTAVDILLSTDQPCWGMLVTTAPATDVVNPVPIECP